MDNSIVVNIAWIPNENLVGEWIEFNRSLCYDGSDQIHLDDQWLPHVTLRMGLLSMVDIIAIKEELKDFEPLDLEFKLLSKENDLKIWTQFAIPIERGELQKHHEFWMKDFRFKDEKQIKTAHFSTEKIKDQRIVRYVKDFKSQAYSSYWPHVTLGRGNHLVHNSKTWKGSGSHHLLAVGNYGRGHLL